MLFLKRAEDCSKLLLRTRIFQGEWTGTPTTRPALVTSCPQASLSPHQLLPRWVLVSLWVSLSSRGAPPLYYRHPLMLSLSDSAPLSFSPSVRLSPSSQISLRIFLLCVSSNPSEGGANMFYSTIFLENRFGLPILNLKNNWIVYFLYISSQTVLHLFTIKPQTFPGY